MKFTIDRARFKELFAQAAAATSPKSPKPILKYVLCRVGPKGINLVAFTGETSLSLDITGDIDVKQHGECLMPGDKVRQLLSEFTGQTVTFTLDGTLNVECDRAKSRLQVADTKEFPTLPETPEGGCVVSGVLLELALKQTVYACDLESTRYSTCGVFFDDLTLVATDSRRMAFVTLDGQGEIPNLSTQCVVPASACKVLQGIAASSSEVTLTRTESMFFAKSDGLAFSARMVEGRFPQWRGVIPKECGTTVKILAASLGQAIRQVNVTTNIESRGLDFAFKNGSLSITSQAADLGDSTAEVPIEIEGDDVEIMLNGQFVLDFLKGVVDSELLTVSLIDAESPVLLESTRAKSVIVPIARA